MNIEEVLSYLPYSKPFLFVDTLEYIDENNVRGSYTYEKELEFYKGHFINNPVTPGVILTETMAQIGLACLGIYLLKDSIQQQQPGIALTSSEVSYYLPVFPGETVKVVANKVYFRFGKLKCSVSLWNEAGQLACDGTLAGMIITKKNEQ